MRGKKASSNRTNYVDGGRGTSLPKLRHIMSTHPFFPTPSNHSCCSSALHSIFNILCPRPRGGSRARPSRGSIRVTPRTDTTTGWRQELRWATAGLTGVSFKRIGACLLMMLSGNKSKLAGAEEDHMGPRALPRPL
jgi:hypothetical protein